MQPISAEFLYVLGKCFPGSRSTVAFTGVTTLQIYANLEKIKVDFLRIFFNNGLWGEVHSPKTLPECSCQNFKTLN